MSALLLFIAIYIGVFALIFFVVWKIIKWFIDNLFSAGTTIYCYNQDKKTMQHYYDHEDKYYDYLKNQWFYKQL